MAWPGVAWWPGGRTRQKAESISPASTASVARRQPPAARSAASYEREETAVSMSSARSPASIRSRTQRIISGRCTSSRSAWVASSAATGVSLERRPLSSSSAIMACRRSAFSGWPSVSCSR